MPTVKKRINVTVGDELYKMLCEYRDVEWGWRSWSQPSMSFICRHILLVYLRDWRRSRV